MRVAVVYPMAFGDDGAVGGGERYALELARALSRRTETRLVLAGRSATRERDGDLRIDTYPPLTYVRPGRSNPVTLRFLKSLADVDVVHCVSYHTLMTDFALLYARAFGKRVYITDVGGGGWLSLARVINVSGLATGMLFLSRFAASGFREGCARSEIIYGGVDTVRFRPRGGQRQPKAVFVGRLLPHKGIDYLIEGIDPAVELVVVGRPYSTSYLATLKALARGKRVEFVHDADDARVSDELASATVAVLPSVYTTREGTLGPAPELLGLAALEAMASGTPVVLTNVGSLPEIIDDGVSGCLVEPNDASALGSAVADLISHPDRAAAMGKAARSRVMKHFTWGVVAAACLDAYESRPTAVPRLPG